MKSIAVFYASEGTGHRTAAENLAERFKLDNPDGQTLCADILDCVPKLLHAGLSNYYLWTVRWWPWLWGKSYWGSDKPGVTKFCCDVAHKLLCTMYISQAERRVREMNAEAVFFTHYFGAEHFAKRNPDIPVFFVNTDYETHIFQRSGIYAASFVPSRTALGQYAKENIENVYNSGIPVAAKFETALSKETARKKLGIDKNRRVILVSGGGIGAGSIETVARSLAKRKDRLTVVICGNNKSLRKKLERIYKNAENVRIEGYVNNMEEFYRAADLGIIKPGGLTLAETLACGLPLLIMNPVPGQEECNLRCVCGEGAALKLDNAEKAAETAELILDNPQKLAELTANAKRIARPDAAEEILKIAGQIIKHTN